MILITDYKLYFSKIGCTVTREKVLLYKTCSCYVIINQASYTRVLSIV